MYYHCQRCNDTLPKLALLQELNVLADVTFPAPPVLVSLRDYDAASVAPAPVPGYPLVCITVSW